MKLPNNRRRGRQNESWLATFLERLLAKRVFVTSRPRQPDILGGDCILDLPGMVRPSIQFKRRKGKPPGYLLEGLSEDGIGLFRWDGKNILLVVKLELKK